MNGMLVHHKVTLSTEFDLTHLYTWEIESHCESSVLPENKAQCPHPGLKPGTTQSGVERTSLKVTVPPTI